MDSAELEMANDAVWISERDVVDLLDLREAIGALGKGVALEAQGRAQNMRKTMASWDGHTLHAVGAVMEGFGLVGTKTWAHTAGGACPLLVLFDSETGELQAVVEAFALGQMRTAGISGLATGYLAPEQADELAIVGTGKQALPQVAAVHAVRPLRRLRVFSPSESSRERFTEQARSQFPFEVVVTGSVEDCVRDTPLVTLVTRATEPFLTGSMLARGAHVNAVGAIAPDREEFSQDLFERVRLVVVDTLDSVQRLNREFMQHFGAAEGDWSQVSTLSAVINGTQASELGGDITLFKAMGMGISDLSLGAEVLQRARDRGRGRSVPQPEKIRPRLI